MNFIRNFTYLLSHNIICKNKELYKIKYSKDILITNNTTNIITNVKTILKKYEMSESHSIKPYTVFKFPK